MKANLFKATLFNSFVIKTISETNESITYQLSTHELI